MPTRLDNRAHESHFIASCRCHREALARHEQFRKSASMCEGVPLYRTTLDLTLQCQKFDHLALPLRSIHPESERIAGTRDAGCGRQGFECAPAAAERLYKKEQCRLLAIGANDESDCERAARRYSYAVLELNSPSPSPSRLVGSAMVRRGQPLRRNQQLLTNPRRA